MKNTLAILLLFCCIVLVAQARDYIALSTSAANVQAAVNACANGDRAIVPSGSATWSTTVTITNGITLIGGGGTNGVTTITQGGGGNNCVEIDPIQTYPSRLTGFTILSSTSSKVIQINGDYTDALPRVDHCTFTSTTGGSTLVQLNAMVALIDHCNFAAPLNSEMIHNMAYGATLGLPGWIDTVVPGTNAQVYIEDCTFTNNDLPFDSGSGYYSFSANSAVQAYYGARTVFRHNTLFMSQVDIHGNSDYGGRWWEIYSNNWYFYTNGPSGPPDQDRYCALRAGSGVVFGNHSGSGNDRQCTIDFSTEGGGDSLNYGPPGKGVLVPANGSGIATTNACYAWGNDAIMVVAGQYTEGVNWITNTVMPGYTALAYPYPLAPSGTPSPTGLSILPNTVIYGTTLRGSQ